MDHLTRRTLLKLAPMGTLAALLAACGTGNNLPAVQPTTPATPDALSPEFTARQFLDAWRTSDFDTMYSLLSPEAQAATPREDFQARYQGVLAEATVYEFESKLVAAGRLSDREGAAEFELLYRTRLVGDLTFRPRMNLVLGEGSTWRVAWSPSLIIPDLGDTNRLRLFPRTSTRGVIYDRKGESLATQGAIVTLGVVPAQITDEATMLALLSELTGLPPAEIAEKYAGQPAEWFIPIADIPFERSQANYDRLVGTPGINLREQAVRAYPQGTVGAHLLGYVGNVNADELAALGERGYEETDFVGKQGIERWGEPILAGKKGGRLVVLSPEGNEVKTLADVPAIQSRSLYLTIDLGLQRAAEQALAGRKGSIVVVDVASGEVLAMASGPSYDPNIMANGQDPAQIAAIASDAAQPLVNRATQGAYPSGSLFKVITMAAGMELAGLPRTDSHFCPGVWTGLGFPMRCWKSSGHGTIDLFHGLEQSCNVVFFETGLALYNKNVEALQQMAAAFGVGSPTGVEVDESAGLLPSPAWKQANLNDVWVPGDTVNMAIGQGFLQTTPVQMARMALVMATSGVVREFTLVNRAEDPTGVTPAEFFPRAEPPRLGIRAETMNTIREAMRAVAVPPMGTASDSFGSFPVAIAGKTGTAETIPGQPTHAWFTGFAPYDQPQIAFLGMLEYGGEGSGAAAPMIKQVLAHYFGV